MAWPENYASALADVPTPHARDVFGRIVGTASPNIDDRRSQGVDLLRLSLFDPAAPAFSPHPQKQYQMEARVGSPLAAQAGYGDIVPDDDFGGEKPESKVRRGYGVTPMDEFKAVVQLQQLKDMLSNSGLWRGSAAPSGGPDYAAGLREAPGGQ